MHTAQNSEQVTSSTSQGCWVVFIATFLYKSAPQQGEMTAWCRESGVILDYRLVIMLGLEGYWLLVRGGYYKQKPLYEAECCKATLDPKLLLLSR